MKFRKILRVLVQISASVGAFFYLLPEQTLFLSFL